MTARVTRHVWLRTPSGDTFKLTEDVVPTNPAQGEIPLPYVELNGGRDEFQLQWSADIHWLETE